MKLLTKTILYIVTLSLFLFFIMGIIFFHVLKKMSMNELHRDMMEMRETVEENLDFLLKTEAFELPGIDSLFIQRTDESAIENEKFSEALLLDDRSSEYRAFHVYTFHLQHKGILYKAKLFRSTTPYDKLVEGVTLMMTGMMILFIGGIFLLNRFIFSNLWRDFFKALDKLKSFDVAKEAIKAEDSDIEEFTELNEVLGKITMRLSQDYKELKDYSDHTSHELQTPLAIIKSRIELLLQSKNLAKKEVELLRDIYKNADHLSRLNSTLAIFTRLENQQYREKQKINISKLLNDHLEMLHELIGLKNLKVFVDLSEDDVILTMDKGLADVIITNLLKNAIIHNTIEGEIHIELFESSLTIRNTGERKSLSTDHLFRRFYRESKKKEGFGLGLALVKKICDFYNFSMEYSFHHNMHSFKINFRNITVR